MPLPTDRISRAGATPHELAAIQAGYDSSDAGTQRALDLTLEGMADSGLQVELARYRAGAAFGGAQFSFGARVALLVTDPSQAGSAIDIYTGAAIPVGAGSALTAGTVDAVDTNGNPTSVTEGGVTTTYTWNLDGTVATESKNGVTKTYIYGNPGSAIPTSWTVA